MLMLNCERKQFIGELQKKEDKLDIIDFLREHFCYEYPEIFEKELEEKIKIAQSKLNYAYDVIGDYDIRKYTFYVLKKELPVKLNIKSEYLELKELKVIIFFENLLEKLDDKDESDIEKNKKINESKTVYSFFRWLIAKEKCNLSKHNEAIRILDFEFQIKQENFGSDENSCIHHIIKDLILEKYLIPFIEEYKNYL